jgi:hypothetical protein
MRQQPDLILAVRNPHTTASLSVRKMSFHFVGAPGSPARAASVAEYERAVEAFKGQGCDVFVTKPEMWARGARPSWGRGL